MQIRIIEEAHAFNVAIHDDGVGIDSEQLAELRKERAGIVIHNTNRLLKQLFGQELSIFSRKDEGTTVAFEVPKR